MPSRLGIALRKARLKRGVGLRELARRICKSPAYIVALESSDERPGVSEATLRRIAAELALDPDTLMALARKTPADVRPRSSKDVYLYRLISGLAQAQKDQLITQLERAAPTRTKQQKGDRN